MTGRPLPAGDDGRADPHLAAALAADDGSPAARARVLAALAGARVFVAVAATATGERVDAGTGLPAESGARLALLSLRSPRGARAVPAFADVATLAAWRPEVRPVPVAARYLCRAALDDGAVAVLLDPGRAAVTLAEDEVRALADGYVPVPGADLAVRRARDRLTEPPTPPEPALVQALAAALRPERLRGARLLHGPHGPVLGVVPRGALDAAAAAALAQRVRVRLGPALPAGGLDLAVVPPDGPGHPLPLARGSGRFGVSR